MVLNLSKATPKWASLWSPGYNSHMNVSPVQTLLPASPHLLFLLFSAQHCSWHHHHTSVYSVDMQSVSDSHNRLHRQENFCRKVLHVVHTEVWLRLVQKLLVTTSSSLTHKLPLKTQQTASGWAETWTHQQSNCVSHEASVSGAELTDDYM